MEDGKEMATMEARNVRCLAVSKDGRWIAAGTDQGEVFVWDAETYEKVFSHGVDYVSGVDFSPDSTRLVSGSTSGRTASIWDITTCKRVQTLVHSGWVRAAKYSPQGDRIATAASHSIRVWDSNDVAHAHRSNSHPVTQHRSPLVQQPPPCHIQQYNQAIQCIHRVISLGMASSR